MPTPSHPEPHRLESPPLAGRIGLVAGPILALIVFLLLPGGDGGLSQRLGLALEGGEPAGFVRAILDEDETWGALLDNLHVLPRFQGKGLGKRLMKEAASWVSRSRPGSPLHLWVIEGNEEARSFYDKLSGKPLDRKPWNAPDGRRVSLVRYVWNDATCVE